MQAMVFSFLALAIGFLGVVFGADRFVEGAAKIARALGISELVIGLTLVGIGSSAPEILVSMLATLERSAPKTSSLGAGSLPRQSRTRCR